MKKCKYKLGKFTYIFRTNLPPPTRLKLKTVPSALLLALYNSSALSITSVAFCLASSTIVSLPRQQEFANPLLKITLILRFAFVGGPDPEFRYNQLFSYKH